MYNQYLTTMSIQTTNQKNKSKVFQNAWQIFKKFKVTFSQALVEAWKNLKRQLLVDAYNKIPSTRQYTKRKIEAKTLWQSITSIRYDLRNVVNNDGAAAYYGIGAYCAD